MTTPFEWWRALCTTSQTYSTILFAAREDVNIRLPYPIYVGNIASSPKLNTLFTTVNNKSGWYTSSSSTVSFSGTYLYVNRNDGNYVNFYEI